MITLPDHYETLQVHPKADETAIDAAYARLSERYDPAKLEGAADELIELARTKRDAIEHAYAVLRDPVRRAAYDREQAASATNGQKPGAEPASKSRAPATKPRAAAEPDVPTQTADTAEELFDYRPLPPAHRQERPKGFEDRMVRAGQSTPHGRTAKPKLANRLTIPITLAGVLVLIVASSLLLTNGGGPAPAAPTPTASQFDLYESSIPQAQAFAEQNPQNAQAWIDLGNVLYDSAQIVREQAPESPLYQQRLGRWLQATNAYSQALALEPNNAPTRADMGASACFYGAGTGDQTFVQRGLADVQRAAAIAPDDARVLLSMGQCLVSTQPPKLDAALASWQRIIDRNPSSPLVSQAQLLIAKYKPKSQ